METEKKKKIVWDKNWKIVVWKGIYVVYERKLLKQIYDILNVKLFKINLKQCRSISLDPEYLAGSDRASSFTHVGSY